MRLTWRVVVFKMSCGYAAGGLNSNSEVGSGGTRDSPVPFGH